MHKPRVCTVCNQSLGSSHAIERRVVLAAHIKQAHPDITNRLKDIISLLAELESEFKDLSGLTVSDRHLLR